MTGNPREVEDDAKLAGLASAAAEKMPHRRAPKGAWADVPRWTEYGGDAIVACPNCRG